MNYRGNLPDWVQEQLRELYWNSLRKLDTTLARWIAARESEATILMTGDHGEEFDHGLLTHSRLYDETIKIPFLVSRPLGTLMEGNITRQLDIAPTIADALDISQPKEWEGIPARNPMPPQPMIGSLSQHDRFWLGIRSERWKGIKRFKRGEGFEETEVYDLNDDPDEVNPLHESEFPKKLAEALDSFIEDRLYRANSRKADTSWRGPTQLLRVG